MLTFAFEASLIEYSKYSNYLVLAFKLQVF